MKQIEQDVAVSNAQPNNRIVAFDIMRGWFLAMILIDHIELYPSGFDYLTGRGRLLVSAAEGFFFMSGLLVGLVYRRRVANGMKFVFKKMWTRATQLYIGSVVLTLFFTFAAFAVNHPAIKYGIYDSDDWKHIIQQTVLMRYGFGWADFLDRFAILMFLAPFAFFLLVKRKWWLLILASIAAWEAGQHAAVNNFTLSWQIIFVGGMGIGFYWNGLTARWLGLSAIIKRRIRLSVASLAAITFVFSYASVYLLSVLNQKFSGLPLWLQHLTLHWNTVNAWIWQFAQKWTMGPVRIVLFGLWFWTLFMWVKDRQKAISRYSLGTLELLGRNSLFVYIAHAFIVFIFKLYIPDQTTFVENFFITAAALAALVGVTLAYKKIQPKLNFVELGHWLSRVKLAVF